MESEEIQTLVMVIIAAITPESHVKFIQLQDINQKHTA